MFINDYLPVYLSYCEAQKRLNSKTIKAYRIDLTQFCRYCEENNNKEISKASVEAYITFLNSMYKPRSVKRKIASVKCFLYYLEECGYLDNNPFHDMRICLPKGLSLPRVIPMTTIRAMLLMARNQTESPGTSYSHFSALRNEALLEMLFATGMRVSEICDLRAEDIDLDEGLVFVHGKGNRERIIEIENQEVLSILNRYNRNRPINTEYFFLNNRGAPLSTQSARIIVRHAAESVNSAKRITPHMLRHSFATLLLEENVDIRYIQQFLGHSSIMTTQIYTYVSSEKRRSILAAKHPRNKICVDAESSCAQSSPDSDSAVTSSTQYAAYPT